MPEIIRNPAQTKSASEPTSSPAGEGNKKSGGRRKAHAEIVKELVTSISERGQLPWERNWHLFDGNGPKNLVSGKPYNGFNVLVLSAIRDFRGYDSSLWLTLRQLRNYKGSLKTSDEKPAYILKFLFFNPDTHETQSSPPRPGETVFRRNRDGTITERTVEEGEKWIPFPRPSLVYNVSQTTGLEKLRRVRLEEEAAKKQMEPVVIGSPEQKELFDQYESVLAAYREELEEKQGREFLLRYQQNVTPHVSFDSENRTMVEMVMPLKEQFSNYADYLLVLSHEHIHSTGFVAGRPMKGNNSINPDDKAKYSFEELVAEIGANLLMEDGEIRDFVPNKENSAAYLKGWIERLNSDPSLLWQASKHSIRAVNYIADGIKVRESISESGKQVERPSVGEHIIEPTAPPQTLAPDVPEEADPITAITIDFRSLDESLYETGLFSVSFANSTNISPDEVFIKLLDFSDQTDEGLFNPEQIGVKGNNVAPQHQIAYIREEITSHVDGRDITDFIAQWEKIKKEGWKHETRLEVEDVDVPEKSTRGIEI